jgi:hypothetical protein
MPAPAAAPAREPFVSGAYRPSGPSSAPAVAGLPQGPGLREAGQPRTTPRNIPTLTAAALTERGIPTASGRGTWQAVQVSRVLARIGDAT